MWKERFLPRCECEVYDFSAYEDGYSGSCEEPAVAYIWWGEEEKLGLYVCEQHYFEIDNRDN